jgi:hypothetical protein
MERKYDHNSQIVYVDTHGRRHAALVTGWWGPCEPGTYGHNPSLHHSTDGEPGCNCLYVVDDETKTDPYGRQIERATSVVHKSSPLAGTTGAGLTRSDTKPLVGTDEAPMATGFGVAQGR